MKRYLSAGTAHVVAGFFTKGVTGTIAAQTASVLPLIGGEYTLRQLDFRFEKFNGKDAVRFGSAVAETAGTRDPAPGPMGTSSVTATLEDVEILGVLKIDRIKARLECNLPLNGPDGGTITVTHAQFEGLSVRGHVIVPNLELDSFVKNGGNSWTGLHDRFFRDADFRKREISGSTLDPSTEAIYMTLVDQPGQSFPSDGITCAGNVIDVKDFGRIHVGEYLVTPYKRHLTMLRLELSGAVDGKLTVVDVYGNGQPYPP
ncbi:MAG: hypothetical protein M3O35_00870 [Acidobacteriota bacterium]|nr:hypothetical protein [Acidobacteriota bacterium]